MIKPLTPSIAIRCPEKSCRARCRIPLDRAGPIDAHCTVCKQPIAITVPAEFDAGRGITQCACCPGREFFIRKDFPQRLGMLLVVVFGLVATCFYFARNVPMTFAVLGSLVVVDAVIYLFVGKVTVCYRCRAEYRGFAYNPDHEGFDLATSEKYES